MFLYMYIHLHLYINFIVLLQEVAKKEIKFNISDPNN